MSASENTDRRDRPPIVYIASKEYDCEGERWLGVFASEEGAVACVRQDWLALDYNLEGKDYRDKDRNDRRTWDAGTTSRYVIERVEEEAMTHEDKERP